MTTKRRKIALITQAGPYTASSRADGVIMLVPDWTGATGQKAGPDGEGGPSFLLRLSLAADIRDLLNTLP